MVQKLRPFIEGVDFAYWWSFSGGGSAINGATPSSLIYFILDEDGILYFPCLTMFSFVPNGPTIFFWLRVSSFISPMLKMCSFIFSLLTVCSSNIPRLTMCSFFSHGRPCILYSAQDMNVFLNFPCLTVCSSFFSIFPPFSAFP